ncbi:MAG: hypothetical protein CVV50_04010, partial [Spirochaetae bacterium HGW-Spirochaetae-6]
MIKTIVRILIILILFPLLLAAQKRIYFVGAEPLDDNVQTLKARNFHNYTSLVYLKKQGRQFVLKLKTFLGKKGLTQLDLAQFNTSENINYDFVMDHTNLYVVYQTPENRIYYQKYENIYVRPLPGPRQEINRDQLKVYSLPSIYKFGKSLYILYHRESDRNKIDIVMQVSTDERVFSEPFNFTENLGYSIYPQLYLLNSNRLAMVFQARPKDTAGKIYFEIYYYHINIEGNKILLEKTLTNDIGDNFKVQGKVFGDQVLLAWENRLNNWRIMVSVIKMNTGEIVQAPRILTSNFFNYRSPQLTQMGEDFYLTAQRMGGRQDRLFYYNIKGDGSVSEERDLGLDLSAGDLVSSRELMIYYIGPRGVLTRAEQDNGTSPIELTNYFEEKNTFSSNNMRISWKP